MSAMGYAGIEICPADVILFFSMLELLLVSAYRK